MMTDRPVVPSWVAVPEHTKPSHLVCFGFAGISK
jgi:hypothetical protein